VAALLDQGTAPGRLLPTLLQVLQEAPDATVLVFEDVHWADNATLDLMKYLGRRVSLLRAMLVLSLRSDEVGADHPLAQVLGDLPSGATTRISLQPLSPEAVATLAQRAGHSGIDLHRITAGNPFFVTEILAGSEAEPGRIPASIRDAVWARLARLPAGQRDVLEIMSIVPGNVEPWVIHNLLGEDADDAVESCVARGLLVRDDQAALTFRHELARQATLERLTPSAQKALHGRIEAAMSDSAAAPAIVSLSRRVHHAAGADDGARVLNLAPQAAAQAARLGAHQQAATHLATALRYVAQAPKAVAAQLQEDWAYEAGLALRIDESVIEARQRAIALWRELGRLDKVGLNLRWLSRLHWYRGEARQAEDYADQAVRELESLPPGPELAMAYSTRSQLHMLHDRVDEAVDWGLRAIALAEQLGEIETRVHALNNIGTALLLSGRPGGRERMEESLTLALQHGFHEQAARAYTNYAEYAVVFKDFALAERILAEGIAFDTKHDLDAWTHYLVGRQAQLRMEQGRLRDAETIACGVVNLERLTLVMRLPALTVLGRVRVRLGETDGPGLLQRALADGLATGEPQNIVPVRLALAEAAWLVEDMRACHAQLDELAAMRLDNFDPWELGELAIWWRRSGMMQRLPVSMARIAAPRAAELRGDPLTAAAEWTRLHVPYEAALALTQVSGIEAGPAFARAVCILEAIEARAAATMARRLAARLGVAGQLPKARRGPYGIARGHPLGLTQREVEVLDLVARGFSNKEIARHLVRSTRTIENHVSAIIGKLNAANRMDVVLRLRSEPWLLSPTDPGSVHEI
jgi:ATP/maltotriose-dependent transcriptional regulator MalT